MPKISQPEEHAINVAAPAGFDAQAVAISRICKDQAKVAPRLLHPSAIQERFQFPPEWEPEITDENRHVIAADIIAKRQAAGTAAALRAGSFSLIRADLPERSRK